MFLEYKVKLSKLIKEFSWVPVYEPVSSDEVFVKSRNVSRPGIELTGFLDYYDKERILIIGNTEYAYMKTLKSEQKCEALDKILLNKPPAIVVARGLDVFDEIIEIAKKYKVPIYTTQESTSILVSALVAFLNVELAPRITKHGVLMEIYGEGVLIVGDSGVGKSETAIELIKRGHRLIADDSVEIKKVSKRSLVGSSPDNIRHFIELRGIGIINAMRIFGVGAVKLTEKIDMVINLEIWDKSKIYDRMGLDEEVTEIMGIQVPIISIPVKTGRNLAVIIEVATMNSRQKRMGYHAAKELLGNLGMDYDTPSEPTVREFKW